VRKFRNANMAPSRHASYLRLRCLKATWPVEAVLAELEALTPPALQARHRPRRDEFCVRVTTPYPNPSAGRAGCAHAARAAGAPPPPARWIW